MFFLRSVRSHPEFRLGMRATASVAPGIAACSPQQQSPRQDASEGC